MIVGIDPVTGALGMPTPEQMRELFPLGVAALNQSSEGLPIIHGPGGAVGVDLQGRFQEYYVVRIAPDGKKVVECTDDPAAMKQAINPNQPAPAGYEVK
jgi:hypothetical protein